MTKKIFKSTLAATVRVLAAALLLVTGVLYQYFGKLRENQLAEELNIAAAGVEAEGTRYLAAIKKTNDRFTWVDSAGKVIYDSRADRSKMENHKDREEIRQAMKTGTGTSVRYSDTLMRKTIYRARRLSDGSVLRVSVSRATVGNLVLRMVQPITVILIFAGVLSFISSKSVADRVVKPMNNINLDEPMSGETYEELSPLLHRIYSQQEEIKIQTENLKKQRREFANIADNMGEALVLLNNENKILSINRAAAELFGIRADCKDQNFLTVYRKNDMYNILQETKEQGHAETRCEIHGRIYQFQLSKIQDSGIVLLAFDVTERVNAEKIRQEFTANVSHELKTPLQGIIGSAELMKKGLVKPEDQPRFIRSIHDEALRLLDLINDIIKLSKLDGEGQMPKENFSIKDICADALSTLKPMAGEKNVTVSCSGDRGQIKGVKSLIYETVYNLLENAIKYNRDGGVVQIYVIDEKDSVRLTVEDNGIGIPPEDKQRVFERFYRGDKSHSGKIDGTGLGLSIVKRAVAYHGGTVTLESQEGRGTEISVLLPKNLSECV